jgi:hypothetical protein
MVEKKGGRWGVPSLYSGTKSNNFLTQSVNSALEKNKNVISYLFKKYFISALK